MTYQTPARSTDQMPQEHRFVASALFARGEHVLTPKQVKALSTIAVTSHEFCENCLKMPRDKSFKCRKCEQLFCSEKCKKACRQTHPLACTLLQTTERLALKMYNLNAKASDYHDVDKSDARQDRDKRSPRAMQLSTKFLEIYPSFSESTWHSMYRIAANTFYIGVGDTKNTTGPIWAVLKTRGNIAHSCDPNCELKMINGLPQLIARRDIANAELLTISYIPMLYTFLPRKDRKRLFLDAATINCKCPRCGDNWTPPDNIRIFIDIFIKSARRSDSEDKHTIKDSSGALINTSEKEHEYILNYITRQSKEYADFAEAVRIAAIDLGNSELAANIQKIMA